nr:response regulator transcription factor [uncultured Psychroserpens sp.]
MTKIFIIEDNIDQLAVIEDKLNILGYHVVGKSTDGTTINSKIKESNPNIVLMDINLRADNEGIFLAEQLKKNFNISIIFITAMATTDVIKNAISIAPSNYLVKPVKISNLKAAIELAMFDNNKTRSMETNLSHGHLTVRIGYKLQKISFEDIISLEIESKNYINLRIVGQNKSAVVRNSLKMMCDSTLPHFFVQVHRQYIVNLNFVQLVNEKERRIHMKEGKSIPIGLAYKASLYKKLNIL